MINYKIVDAEKLNADLETIAHKLRTKTSVNNKFIFPDGFIEAIDIIETGTGTNKFALLAEDAVSTISTEDLDGLSLIRPYAFAKCNFLKLIDIPEGVTSIGECAFWECNNLETLNFPTSLCEIGIQICENCLSLKKINLSGNILSIPFGSFRNCTSLNEIIINEGITNIGEFAFENCTSLENIIFPSSIQEIENFAFYYCTNLKSITILRDTPPIISSNSFEYCPLTKITVPIGTSEYYKSSTNWADFAGIIEEVAE